MIKLFEMFAGYGGASFALKKAGIPFECVGFSEIDKFAIQCYQQNHEGVKCHGDCNSIDPNTLPDFDFLTGGFPCQAFSVAGKGLGESDSRGTLFNDIIRIAEVKKPSYMLLENVKGLTSKKHKQTFDKILSELDRIGYIVNWKVLNSKDYGTPQNRERVWFVCFRKGTDANYFSFPERFELNLFLKDILEESVEEKYMVPAKRITRLLNPLRRSDKGRLQMKKYADCLLSCDYKDPKSTIVQSNNPNHSINRIYSPEGINPTLNTMQGGDRQPFIQAQPLRFLNRNQKNFPRDYSFCVDASQTSGVKVGYMIRKLTPKECFRLMGFFNDEINLEGLSNTQQYKLAGNGWDINLVSKLMRAIINKQGGRT